MNDVRIDQQIPHNITIQNNHNFNQPQSKPNKSPYINIWIIKIYHPTTYKPQSSIIPYFSVKLEFTRGETFIPLISSQISLSYKRLKRQQQWLILNYTYTLFSLFMVFCHHPFLLICDPKHVWADFQQISYNHKLWL